MKLNKTRCLLLAVCIVMPVSVLAVQPRMEEYAFGMRIEVPADRPVAEFLMPDAVYRTTTRADLADVRIFNGEGKAVAHALCASAAVLTPLVSRKPLRIFTVQAPDGSSGTRVDVQTERGTQIEIHEAARPATATATPSAHVIDARGMDAELRKLEVDWNSPDGASEARVQIQASEDLDAWQTVVAASTLLQVSNDSGQLRRQQIPLPQRPYSYLRVRRIDAGPALHIGAAAAEVVAAPVAIEPVWFNATPSADTAGTLLYSSERLAPVRYARLLLHEPNSSVRIALQTRSSNKARWQTRWSGEFYTLVANGERRSSAPAEFAGTVDRYWRVMPDSAASLPDVTTLELGYRPVKLRFLTQGAGPFTLAYGSRRAAPAPVQACDRLLADIKASDFADLVGQAATGEPRSLGGHIALKPLPHQTPLRLMVLWAVLILGVGLLIAMATSLFRRLQP